MADDPYYHAWKMDAPDYGGDPNRFTVEITHNGFFSGLHEELLYIDGTTVHFDNCNVDSWSILWIEDFLNRLGCEIHGRLQVYWCRPDKDISDGLVCIESDAEIVSMIQAATQHKTLYLFVDHTNFVKELRSDLVKKENIEEDLVINGKNVGGREEEDDRMDMELPERPKVSQQTMRGKEKLVEEENEETDSEFYDSDFDAEDGYDDIFAANVDRQVNDHNEAFEIVEVEDDAGLENEDLQLTKEQEEEQQYKFKVFNLEVDMEHPDFKVGMVFSNVKVGMVFSNVKNLFFLGKGLDVGSAMICVYTGTSPSCSKP